MHLGVTVAERMRRVVLNERGLAKHRELCERAASGSRISAIKWGLSKLDWRSHAIDERAYHPVGVYVAECGHLLMMVVTLHDRPNGRPCAAYGGKQARRAGPQPHCAWCAGRWHCPLRGRDP